MIVNKEIQNTLDANGNFVKRQIISYVGKDGTIQYLTYDIPKSEWFNWAYAKRQEAADGTFKSWDKKRVVKKYQPYDAESRNIADTRVHEILCQTAAAYPAVNAIYDLNNPITAYIDIEVEVDDSGFPVPDKASNPITTIAYCLNDTVTVFGRVVLTDDQIIGIKEKVKDYTKKFKNGYNFEYRFYENEYDLLSDFFFNYIKPVPAVTGWNLFGFDWVYLLNRCRILDLDITNISPTGKWNNYKPLGGQYNNSVPAHKVIYDYLEIYKKWDRIIEIKENSTLDFVASSALGITKVQHSLGFADMLKQEPDNYVFYNAIDSVLVREIDQRLKTTNSFFGLANLTHMELLGTISPVRTLEIVQCEYALKEGYVMPLMKKGSGDQADYEGAYVYPTIPGVYRNIAAFDFASLYPTTQRQFNISPDTFIKKDINYVPNPDEIKTVSGAVYKKSEQGILPMILTEFYGKRKAYKRKMMEADEEKEYLSAILEKRLAEGNGSV